MNKENNIKFQKQMNKYQEDCFISLENDCLACEQIKDDLYLKFFNTKSPIFVWGVPPVNKEELDKVFRAAFNAGIKWERSRK